MTGVVARLTRTALLCASTVALTAAVAACGDSETTPPSSEPGTSPTTESSAAPTTSTSIAAATTTTSPLTAHVELTLPDRFTAVALMEGIDPFDFLDLDEDASAAVEALDIVESLATVYMSTRDGADGAPEIVVAAAFQFRHEDETTRALDAILTALQEHDLPLEPIDVAAPDGGWTGRIADSAITAWPVTDTVVGVVIATAEHPEGVLHESLGGAP